MFSQQLQAQPLYVNNNSDIGNYPYDITTNLIYARTGEVCSGADWAVPFTFEAGSMLTINDGSFVWTSPWNGLDFCLSEGIGYGCEPVLLDFYAQRIESVDYANPDVSGYFAGLISTIAGTTCTGQQLQLTLSDPDIWSAALSGDYAVTIGFIDLDIPLSFSSSINYMNWGFMQTLAFS